MYRLLSALMKVHLIHQAGFEITRPVFVQVLKDNFTVMKDNSPVFF